MLFLQLSWSTHEQNNDSNTIGILSKLNFKSLKVSVLLIPIRQVYKFKDLKGGVGGGCTK